jgi:hypothetical protein
MASSEEALAEYIVPFLSRLPDGEYEKDLEGACRSFGFLKPKDKRERRTESSELSSKLKVIAKACQVVNWLKKPG